MQDILYRLKNSHINEGSHHLVCRCIDAAIEIERLRAALRDIHDNQDGARVKAAAALDVPNAELTGAPLLARPVE